MHVMFEKEQGYHNTNMLQLSPVSKYCYKYVLLTVDNVLQFNQIYLLKANSESESKLIE